MKLAKDMLLDQWPRLKSLVQQQWPQLTDADLAALSGRATDLAQLLQERYRYGPIQADMEIRNWLRRQH